MAAAMNISCFMLVQGLTTRTQHRWGNNFTLVYRRTLFLACNTFLAESWRDRCKELVKACLMLVQKWLSSAFLYQKNYWPLYVLSCTWRRRLKMPKKSNKPNWGGRGRANNHEGKAYFGKQSKVLMKFFGKTVLATVITSKFCLCNLTSFIVFRHLAAQCSNKQFVFLV